MSIFNPPPDEVRCCATTGYYCTIQGVAQYRRCTRAGRYVLADGSRYCAQHYKKVLREGKVEGVKVQNICPACHRPF